VTDRYPGRLGLQQRVLPAYRAPLFDALAAACTGGLSVFAGQPRPDESIAAADGLHAAQLVRARNLHFRDPSSPIYLCWQGGLLRWLAAWQPETLIVEANPRYPGTRLAVRWMHARRRPVVGWGLGAPPLAGLLSPFRRWERLTFLRSLDAVIAYSRRGADEYLSLGLPPNSVFVAPNAVTPRPSAPPPERSPQFDGPPRVLFVGRLQARKRIDSLLRACAALPVHLQPKLWIAGEGPTRQEFQEIASQVYPQAEFLGDRRGADLASTYAQADLFVLPGTGGLAVQEAMTHGLPVIVAQGDGTQDVLVRPENGWQIPPNDLESLTAALRQALSDPGRLRTMGRESYRIVDEEVNTDAMVAAFIRAVNSLNGERELRGEG
jgi:glycosyltransferase involved in cell wall biosynthesis